MQETRQIKPAADDTYIRPEKANSLMKKARSIRQTVYIYGSTGFGKTSFIADYFAHRRYEYYSVSDINMTEFNIADRTADAKERIVVIDDLHTVSDVGDRELCYRVLEKLSKNRSVWLILISRAPIPAWLRPLYIKNIFVVIDENDLRFSEKETDDYLKKWQFAITPETEKKLCAKANGQPLFLRIAAMRLLTLTGEADSAKERAQAEAAAVKKAEDEWCDYLEIHVYDRWDIELQEFLTDISIVDCFNLQTAQFITRKK